jgi:Beta galactosidase small chain
LAKWDGWGPPSLPRGTKKKTDATRLIIKDVTGRVIQTYVWPVGDLRRRFDLADQSSGRSVPSVSESQDALTVTKSDFSLRISRDNGLLLSASRGGRSFSIANGPRVVSMESRPAAPDRRHPLAPPPPPPVFAPDSSLTSLTHASDGSDMVISATFDGPMKSLTYRITPSGWLSIDYVYAVTGPHEYFGVGFDYPEAAVKGVRFLGEGPSPVYQNRLAGGTLDVWRKTYNNTIVGDPEDLKPGEHFDYPTFKGFYAGVRWLQLDTSEGRITAIVDQQPNFPVYVQVFAPKFPPPKLAGQTAVPFPNAGVSFLNAIPAIGSKFGSPLSMGPSGQPAIARGEYKGGISFYFGELPKR